MNTERNADARPRRDPAAPSGTRSAPIQVLAAGFIPAFHHRGSDEIHLSLDDDGRVAAAHFLDGLPAAWVGERDGAGRPLALVPAVRAGYLRGDRFWTLAELRHPKLDS